MYLSRLRLNLASRDVRRDLVDCQQMHRTIMSAFPAVAGEESPRAAMGVLYRLENSRNAGCQVYVQSMVAPDWSLLAEGYLMDTASCKEISDALASITDDTVLTFRLRANPTVTVKDAPDQRQGRRKAIQGEESVIQWLVRKAETAGFALMANPFEPDLADVRVTCEARKGARPNGQHQNGAIRFEPVLFEGLLRVTDAARFRQVLGNGVGASRAYGCGLLSVVKRAM